MTHRSPLAARLLAFILLLLASSAAAQVTPQPEPPRGGLIRGQLVDGAGAPIPDGVLAALRDLFAAVRAELGLSLEYPQGALDEAERAAADPPALGNLEVDASARGFFAEVHRRSEVERTQSPHVSQKSSTIYPKRGTTP